MQTVLGNPLAEPYTLGVASGAALGAAIFTSLGWQLDLAGMNIGGMLGAVLVGARLGGPWGALFGVPVAAVMSAMLSFYQLSVAEREQRLKEVVGTNDGLPSTMPSDSSVAPETEPSTGMP